MEIVKDPKKILDLLYSPDPKSKEMGYLSFLRRTHWSIGATADDLKAFACHQLRLRQSDVIATLKRIEPAFLWASQDGLESDKLKMVEAMNKYLTAHHLEFPPIVVWNFFDHQKMRYVIHDGHHRAYFCHKYHIKLSAVILEPLGNYREVESKFRFAFQIQKRVIDLPVYRPNT